MKNLILFIILLFTSNLFAQITIDADFESGNLASFEEIDSVSFYVTSTADIGIDGGSTRWIYFRMNGVKDKEVRVLITNTGVTKAMYSYDNENFVRFTDEETQSSGVFFKSFEEDTVYISFYTPYTYTYLQERISDWIESPYVTLDTLGNSPQGLPIQELIITDSSVPDLEKQSIWIHSRTHTSETPSSWQFDGIMQELLSGDEAVNHYLEKLVFHMIPFTNPDGVYYGRSRTNFEGINLETNWNKSESLTSGEVKLLKARMKELNDEKPFSVFLNLHSQASSYCTFWIHNSSSTSEKFYRREYQFSNLNTSDNQYFVPDDYSESSLKPIYPEGWLWDNYGADVMALTYETPYNSYFKSNSEPYTEVTNDNLFEIGRRTVYAIAEYLEISHPTRFIIDNKDARYAGSKPTTDTISTQFYGEDYSILEPNEVSYTVFEAENLPPGKYDVSGWWMAAEENSYETEISIIIGENSYDVTKTQRTNGGQWNYLTSIEITREGTLGIKLKANSTGRVIADAFRLIYAGDITDIEKQNIPTKFELYQNYPNPFNPNTIIRYAIPNQESNFGSENKVSLMIYDILGREVASLVNQYQYAGDYEVTFNAKSLASGTYIYRLQVGNYAETKKMILLK